MSYQEQAPIDSAKDNKSFISRAVNSFELICSPDTMSQICTYIDNGIFGFVAANHGSHSDGLAVAKLIEEISKGSSKSIKFILPVAASMEAGKQGDEAKNILETFTPVCAAKGVEMIPVVREKDIKKYGLRRNYENLRKILMAHENGTTGIIALPEGSVQGGRKDENGNPYGIGQAEKGNLLDSMIPQHVKEGFNFFVVLAAINKSNNILSPDTFEIKLYPDVDKATITISNTILTNSDFENLNSPPTSLIMRTIASMLPPGYPRGIYK